MKRPPVIVVQLIHMQGPLKGEIQDFSESEVVIGRNPSCHVRFPVELTVVSREHARIVREGNRFKLIDHSANGTIINGKMIKEQEVYLKDGDVLDFAQGGPKVSFLTRMEGVPAETETMVSTPPPTPPSEARPPVKPELASTNEAPIPVVPAEPPPARPQPKAGPEVSAASVQAPVVIQYGPTLQSFKEVPVAIGRSPKSDFVIDHPAIFDMHTQIFFHQNQYWVKDLTGQGKILINKRPIDTQAPLAAEDELALSPEGPFFRFLGGGRLLEVEVSPPEEPEESAAAAQQENSPPPDAPDRKERKRPGSIFKKFLR